MHRHYLKTTVRSLLRKKMYTAINIFGLAVGLALCLMIVGHIAYELSFEDFHENKERIYRVEASYASEDDELSSARVMAPLGPALVAEISEVETVAVFRVSAISSVGIGEERHRIVNEYEGAGYAHGKKLVFAGPEYFEVFTFPLLEGSAKTALRDPQSVLITEKAAKEYFQTRHPVGEMIRINDQFDCRVTGILKDIPQNTQLHCDFIVSYATLESIGEDILSWEQFGSDYAYLLLNDHAVAANVLAQMPGIVSRNLPEQEAEKYSFRLMPFLDIYFNVYGSGKQGELYPAGEASFMYSFALMAAFILIQAIANFINLSTAKSADRLTEVGVRKAFGAGRAHLVRQFIGESVLLACAAMVISMLIYEAFKVKFAGMLPREMFADFYRDPLMLVSVTALIVITGIIAGFYPALYMSRFKPVAVLRSKTAAKSTRSILRKALVVFQFTIAAIFVFVTTVLIRQVNYITSVDLGFETENFLVLDFDGESAADDCGLMKNEILTNSRALAATASNCPPGRKSNRYTALFTDETRREEDRIIAKQFQVDRDFLSTFGLKITSGESFSSTGLIEEGNGIIITESAVKAFGFENAVGSRLYGGGDRFYEVIGVVEDFHGTSLSYTYHSATIITLNPESCTSLAVKLPSDDISGSVSVIKNIWESTIPGVQFDYTFLDDEIAANYDDIRSQGTVFLALAVFTTMIACLGIFGLVSYTAEQRTKEIGIRKILGASVASVVALLSKEFLILVGIANIIAWPVAYMMVRSILESFAFQVSVGIGTFAFVGGMALFFALLTAGFQSVKASLANPIDSLRCE